MSRILIVALLGFSVIKAQTEKQIETVQMEHYKHWGYSTVTWNPSWTPLSAEDALILDAHLQANPEDVRGFFRVGLLVKIFPGYLRIGRVHTLSGLVYEKFIPGKIGGCP